MKKINKEIIPIMFCFDKNYVIPASVCFYSLMENASKDYYYKFYVLTSDISPKIQKKLQDNLTCFKDNVDITFIDMKNKFDDIWKDLKSKVHFSKEVLYKLLVASIFPQYDKIIVSDVDVIFLKDISKSYYSFEKNEDICLAGVKQLGVLEEFSNVYASNFSLKEIDLLKGFCGGYIVFNLDYLRRNNMETIYVEFLKNYADKLIYAEQDVLNLCSKGNIKYLPLNYCTCTYMWDFYQSDKQFNEDSKYTKEELIDAMNNPIQLHYASTEKPWKNVDTIKSEEWFKYLTKTNFLRDYLEYLPNNIVIKVPKRKKILCFDRRKK